ncbi:MAG: cysteine desulfurase family protein [Bacillota bacterium]|nr:cysteine desulfurase family protein [Bacillota bacterium]MDI3316121.1 cysteine desulfurase family protein [Bacillota bacterium]
MIYLDWAATTPIREEVLEAMVAFEREAWANPSSTHAAGRQARSRLEAARRAVRRWLGAETGRIVFTSGGTEADNLAVFGLAAAAEARGRPRRAVTSAIEHRAVLDAFRELERRGWEVTYLPGDGRGLVPPESLEAALEAEPGPAFLSLMWANNETGALQPVVEAARLAHRRGIPVHSDAVQAAPLLELGLDALGPDGPDLVAVSAHKLGGPKGVGALWIRDGLELSPLLFGGGQEAELRPGTENAAGIVGFGRAAELAAREAGAEWERLRRVAGRFLGEVRRRLPDAVLNGPEEVGRRAGARLPSIVNLGFPGVRAESLLIRLDLAGVEASAGAACSAGSLEPSHVIAAMGRPELAGASLRFSFGRLSDEEEAAEAAAIVAREAGALRR